MAIAAPSVGRGTQIAQKQHAGLLELDMKPSAASIRLPEGASALGGIDEVHGSGRSAAPAGRSSLPARPAEPSAPRSRRAAPRSAPAAARSPPAARLQHQARPAYRAQRSDITAGLR